MCTKTVKEPLHCVTVTTLWTHPHQLLQVTGVSFYVVIHKSWNVQNKCRLFSYFHAIWCYYLDIKWQNLSTKDVESCKYAFSRHTFHVADPQHIHLITPVILCEEATQYAVLFSSPKLPLSPTYHAQHRILKHPQPMFFPKYDQPCFPPIYNRHSIVRNDIPLWYMMISHNYTYISNCLLHVLAVVKS